MNATYVLGAGFSRAAGLPLINDFHQALATYRSEIVRQYGQHIFDEYQRVIHMGISIEDSFDELEKRGVLTDVFLLREAVNSVIAAACETYRRTASQEQIAFYSNFLRLVKNQNATILTLNYDTVLECTDDINTMNARAEDGAGIIYPYLSFDYCLAGWEPYRNTWDMSPDKRCRLWFHDIPLIKLHGGINFCLCAVHKWASYADKTTTSRGRICSVKGCGKELEPGIIPPRKVKQITEFSALWDVARNRLAQSQQITLIGVNLNDRDQEFNSLIRNSLVASRSQLGFINYQKNPTEQDYGVWQEVISKRLGFDIPKENISLDGFEPWIDQMNG